MSYFPIRPVWSFFLNSKPRTLINGGIIDFLDKIINEETQILTFESEHEDLENFAHKRFHSQSKLNNYSVFDCKLLRFIAKWYHFLFPSNLSFIGLSTLLLLIWLSTYLPSDRSYTIIGSVTILAAILIKLFIFSRKMHKESSKEAKYALSIIHNGLFAEYDKVSLNPGDIILAEFKTSNINKHNMPREKHLKSNNFEELQSRIIIFKADKNWLNNEERLNISQNFAEDLIISEMELESNFNLRTFSYLIQLYTYAIMFYKDIKESKRKIFKQRLQSLLLKIDLIKLSNSEFQHKVDFSQKHLKVYSRLHKSKQRRQPSDDFCIEYWHPYEISEIHEINAEETIERHDSSNISIWNRVQEDMRNQAQNLSSRIDDRRKSVMNQSFNSLNMSNLSDRSDLEDFEVKFELYQIELEKMMDQFVEKALKETMEIKNRYRESVRKLEDIDNIFVQNKLRVEAERMMKKETDETNQRIDEEKKKTILTLRQKFKLL
ncbi:unnamed protein product [Blepharisma stoltei]|uniref:Uncharacterized protein n=1 Tax=Blepharisma stoltei TaxID=1481888 RepID=A0AAU9JNZ7_9CILI|nr:unnamed protein product [Blepharisma stoltei]